MLATIIQSKIKSITTGEWIVGIRVWSQLFSIKTIVIFFIERERERPCYERPGKPFKFGTACKIRYKKILFSRVKWNFFHIWELIQLLTRCLTWCTALDWSLFCAYLSLTHWDVGGIPSTTRGFYVHRLLFSCSSIYPYFVLWCLSIFSILQVSHHFNHQKWKKVNSSEGKGKVSADDMHNEWKAITTTEKCWGDG